MFMFNVHQLFVWCCGCCCLDSYMSKRNIIHKIDSVITSSEWTNCLTYFNRQFSCCWFFFASCFGNCNNQNEKWIERERVRNLVLLLRRVLIMIGSRWGERKEMAWALNELERMLRLVSIPINPIIYLFHCLSCYSCVCARFFINWCSARGKNAVNQRLKIKHETKQKRKYIIKYISNILGL